MSSYHFSGLRIKTEVFAYTGRNIAVRSAVEAVATDSILLVQLVRNSVHICLIWHCLVESGIKYSHLRNARKCLFNRLNTFEVSRVVKRSEFDALNNHLFYFWSDKHRLIKLLAAVYYTVTYRLHLIQRCDATDLLIHEAIQNQLNTYGMLWHSLLNLHFLTIGEFDLQERVWQTDLLYST